MKILGLTGGIASGKSTAARHLADLGAVHLDADRLGHRAYEPGTPGFDAVVAEFGDHIVGQDGQIDRKALGGEVFGKPDRLAALTAIVWPAIRTLAEAELAAISERQPDAVVVLEAAVLFEAGWEDAVEEVWVVVVDPDVAVARAMARDNSDEDAVRARIAAQLSNDERRDRADVAIDNSGDEEGLHAQLDELWVRVTGE
ncbi:MAG: dephospho-CoA kinase [Pseudomonadota bacterium]